MNQETKDTLVKVASGIYMWFKDMGPKVAWNLRMSNKLTYHQYRMVDDLFRSLPDVRKEIR